MNLLTVVDGACFHEARDVARIPSGDLRVDSIAPLQGSGLLLRQSANGPARGTRCRHAMHAFSLMWLRAQRWIGILVRDFAAL